MTEQENILREVWAIEQEDGKSLTEWVEEIGDFCGVGSRAVWSWYTGTRTPSAAARKLLRLRSKLPSHLLAEVPQL